MQLLQPTEDHLIEMMSWFSSEKDLIDWSGPNFRYLFNLSSFVLVVNESEFLAFGQYYLRLGKCHLGRLIVNPNFRGTGIASELIRKICKLGRNELAVTECSLFVLEHNDNAIKAYKKFGFSFVNYPDKMPLENCLYMVKS
jgi:ribosomal protein S18 acetylase RimI-like enzyme